MYGASDRVTNGDTVMCAPPEIRCRYISEESPTHRSVRPSGEIDAAQGRVVSTASPQNNRFAHVLHTHSG